MNCTSDPGVCQDNGITGYPTISAFRGLGWLGSDHCITEKAKKNPYTRIDYHGVLLVRPQDLAIFLFLFKHLNL